jgi:holo-[acyl-carrier protein] synthase
MIIGIGSDLVEIGRVADLLNKHPQRFIERILTPEEQSIFKTKSQPTHWLAKRFAAKEAVAKALGTGFSQGVSFTDIHISNSALGQPHVALTGPAHDWLAHRATHWAIHLSLTDERRYAQAFVVIEQVRSL